MFDRILLLLRFFKLFVRFKPHKQNYLPIINTPVAILKIWKNMNENTSVVHSVFLFEKIGDYFYDY